jgi:cytochrome P450
VRSPQLIGACHDIIDEWKADRQAAAEAEAAAGSAGISSSTSSSSKGSSGFLQRLLEGRAKDNSDRMTDVQVIAQAFFFTLAGYETTAAGGCLPVIAPMMMR